MKKFQIVLFSLLLFSANSWADGAQTSSFEKMIGKTAANLEQGSFRFGLGMDIRTDKWAGDYSTTAFPFDISLGASSNVEVDLGIESCKSYSFVDGVAIRDEQSFHNFYGGIRFLLNPDQILSKPAIGFWLGMYIPVHKYESFKPTAQFLLSSAIKDAFAYNFNLGISYYLNSWDYQADSANNNVDPGAEVLANTEIGYKIADIFKISTGFEMKEHFLMKKNDQDVNEFASWKWISGVRFKAGDLPLIIDAGVRIGLNKRADESFGFFVRIQLIPDSANTAW